MGGGGEAPAHKLTSAYMSKMTSRSRLFSLTFFREAKPELQIFQYFGGIQDKCPTTGRSHWQCFGYFKDPKTLKGVLKLLFKAGYGGTHVEISKGTLEHNETYCSLGKGKEPRDTSGVDGTQFREGNRPHQGSRTDLKAACAYASAGDFKSIEPTVYMKFHKGLQALYLRDNKPYEGPRTIIWYYGPTETGKSRRARAEYPDAYWQSSDSGWFDHYLGQRVIVVDDIEHGVLSTREFLRMTDRYPYHLKAKGTMLPLLADTIVFTSHFHPCVVFPMCRSEEVLRRITKLEHMAGQYYPATSVQLQLN